jgi:DNA-binding transcriptional LysR family regulator
MASGIIYKPLLLVTILPLNEIVMDRLEAMRVLVAAVDGGSLSAAGRALGMPLATVSRKVSELESLLKTQLLVRTTRKLTETEAGQAFIASCRRILEDVNEAERFAAGEYSAPRGELIVTAPLVFGRLHVLPVAAEFLQAYPEVNLRLVLGDRLLSLQEEHLDAAIRIGELPDSSLIATRLGMVRAVVCASPAYLARRGTPRHPRELRQHDLVVFSGLASPNFWRFSSGKAAIPLVPRARLTVTTAEAAIDGAIAGAGLTCVLSYQAQAAIEAGILVRVLRQFEPPPLPVNFVYASRGRPPQKLRAFIDFVAPRLRVRLQAGV